MLFFGLLVILYYKCKIRSIDRVQTRFLNFAGYRLDIAHPPREYSLISDIIQFQTVI
jgi:hypothetical protein